jgi:hypothetical protein
VSQSSLPIKTLKVRVFRYILNVYLVGVVVMAIYLVWSSIHGGGLEREHSARELLLIALFMTACSVLWPVLLTLACLTYLGVVHGPRIELSPTLFIYLSVYLFVLPVVFVVGLVFVRRRERGRRD